MRVRADKWEPAGIELRDVVRSKSDDHSKFGGTTKIYNNSPHKGNWPARKFHWEKGNASCY